VDDVLETTNGGVESEQPIVLADADVVAGDAAPAAPTAIAHPKLNVKTLVVGPPVTSVKVNLNLGNFDSFLRNLSVQKLSIAFDNNPANPQFNNLFAPAANIGFTVSVANPVQGGNYQIVAEVDGDWQQGNGTTVHFNAGTRQQNANVDSVYAYVFTGPNAQQQAQGFIQHQKALSNLFYGTWFATASASFYEGPAQVESDSWFDAAWTALGSGPTSGNPISRNWAITQNYVNMYNNNPAWAKWAGMAAFAAYTVGTGIAGGTILNLVGPAAPIVGEIPLYEGLQQGNFLVYADIYRQFLEYSNGGLPAIIADPLVQPLQAQGWRWVDLGMNNVGGPNAANNQNLIWFGNSLLLNFEQLTLLQPKVYDKYPKLWLSLSSFAPAALGFQMAPPGSLLASPIPGDNWSFFAVETPRLLGRVLNIGDPNLRWDWISTLNNGQLFWYKLWATQNNNINFIQLMAGGYA
jgi:hypothetical protein